MGSIHEIASEIDCDEEMTEDGKSIPFSNLDRMQYIEDSQKYILDILKTCTIISDYRDSGLTLVDNPLAPLSLHNLPQSSGDFPEIFHDATSERSLSTT
mmetsp:Transcript_10479/g.15786  ORF Transcript_10479/g.15786 Transcript_10479/m.15786 type:complete len:99 (-) Transcript_10479:272-568(-)